jgi:hypothetical protein
MPERNRPVAAEKVDASKMESPGGVVKLNLDTRDEHWPRLYFYWAKIGEADSTRLLSGKSVEIVAKLRGGAGSAREFLYRITFTFDSNRTTKSSLDIELKKWVEYGEVDVREPFGGEILTNISASENSEDSTLTVTIPMAKIREICGNEARLTHVHFRDISGGIGDGFESVTVSAVKAWALPWGEKKLLEKPAGKDEVVKKDEAPGLMKAWHWLVMWILGLLGIFAAHRYWKHRQSRSPAKVAQFAKRYLEQAASGKGEARSLVKEGRMFEWKTVIDRMGGRVNASQFELFMRNLHDRTVRFLEQNGVLQSWMGPNSMIERIYINAMLRLSSELEPELVRDLSQSEIKKRAQDHLLKMWTETPIARLIETWSDSVDPSRDLVMDKAVRTYLKRLSKEALLNFSAADLILKDPKESKVVADVLVANHMLSLLQSDLADAEAQKAKKSGGRGLMFVGTWLLLVASLFGAAAALRAQENPFRATVRIIPLSQNLDGKSVEKAEKELTWPVELRPGYDKPGEVHSQTRYLREVQAQKPKGFETVTDVEIKMQLEDIKAADLNQFGLILSGDNREDTLMVVKFSRGAESKDWTAVQILPDWKEKELPAATVTFDGERTLTLRGDLGGKVTGVGRVETMTGKRTSQIPRYGTKTTNLNPKGAHNLKVNVKLIQRTDVPKEKEDKPKIENQSSRRPVDPRMRAVMMALSTPFSILITSSLGALALLAGRRLLRFFRAGASSRNAVLNPVQYPTEAGLPMEVVATVIQNMEGRQKKLSNDLLHAIRPIGASPAEEKAYGDALESAVRELLRGLSTTAGFAADRWEEALAKAFQTDSNVMAIVNLKDENDLPKFLATMKTAGKYNADHTLSLSVVAAVVSKEAAEDFAAVVQAEINQLPTNVPVSVVDEKGLQIQNDEIPYTTLFGHLAQVSLETPVSEAHRLWSELAQDDTKEKEVVVVGESGTPYRASLKLLSVMICLAMVGGKILMIKMLGILESAHMA